MKHTVTVEEAVTRGKLIVNAPIMLILIGTIILTFILQSNHVIPFWCVPASMLYAPVLSWGYWRFAVRQWVLWAFTNVRNLHELKRRAIEEKIVTGDEKIFRGKSRFSSKLKKDHYDQILQKFKEKDVFIEDPAVPAETKIYHVTDLKNKLSPSPQIILDHQGIYTIFTGFYPWYQIHNETVLSQFNQKYYTYDLYYEHPKGSRILNIDPLNMAPNEIARLLVLYRGRGEVPGPDN